MPMYIVTICADDESNEEQTVEISGTSAADAMKRAQQLFAIVKSARPK